MDIPINSVADWNRKLNICTMNLSCDLSSDLMTRAQADLLRPIMQILIRKKKTVMQILIRKKKAIQMAETYRLKAA
jgi:hypothetical protein